MQIKLEWTNDNGYFVPIPNAIYPIQFSERLDRELDGGIFNTLGDTRKRAYTPVKITIGDNEENTRTFDFYANSSNEWNAIGKKQSCLRLVEPTKELQCVFLDGLAVVQPINGTQKTLLDVVNRLLAVTPLKQVGEQPKYNLTSDAKVLSVLSSRISPEFQWSSQTSLFEALMDIGNCIDAIPRLKFGTAYDGRIITFDLVGEERERIEKIAYYGKLINLDETQYCTELESNVNNLTTKDEFTGTVIFPSDNAFIKPRTNEVRLTDQNCKLITNKRISELTRLWLDADNIVVRYLYDAPSGSSEGDTLRRINLKTGRDVDRPDDTTVYIPPREKVDLSYYVKEYDDWLTLDYLLQSEVGRDTTGAQLSKNNTLYWTRYTNEVSLINTSFSIGVTGLFSDSVFNYMLECWAKHILPDYIPNSITATNTLGQLRTCIFDGVDSSFFSADPRDFDFQVEYIPIEEENKVRARKQSSEYFITSGQYLVDIVQPYNQRAETNSATAYGDNMQGVVNKMGVDYMTTTVRTRLWNNVRHVGDVYVENNTEYIITSIDYNIVSADTIECVYTLSKDWNYISQYFNIDKKFRSWNIPSTNIQRNLYWKDVCLISPYTRYFENDSAFVEIYDFDRIFKNEITILPPANVCAITQGDIDSQDYEGVVLQSSSFVFGNSVCLFAKTKDNLSAGVFIEKSNDGNQYCKDALYCNEDGTMPSCDIAFGRTISNMDNEKYPKSKISATDNDNIIGSMVVKLKNLNVQKESTECLAINYQLFFETNDKGVVIGQGLAERCGIASYETGGATTVWGLTKRLPKMAKYLTAEYGEQTQGTVSTIKNENYLSVTVDLPNADNYIGWAIAVGDKLVLAQYKNGNYFPKTLFFSFYHKN